MPIKGPMTQEHKDRISESQRARWARAKELRYDMDTFDFLVPEEEVVERLNERARGGWIKDEMLVKNGIIVIYRKGG